MIGTTNHTTKKLSPKAIVILQTIADYILANPKEYDQSVWDRCIAGLYTKLFANTRTAKMRAQAHKEWSEFDFESYLINPYFKAFTKVVKLYRPLDLLGGASFWPEKFTESYYRAKTSKGRARAAYNYLQYFIKTNGAE